MQPILNKVKGDKVLWGVVIMLACISVLAVYSATMSLEWRLGQNTGHYLFKQFTELALGFVIIFVVHRMNYAKFAKWSRILFYLSIPLLLYTLFFGTTLNEGARWIKIPGTGKTIQSSDLAKLSIFLFLSLLLSRKQHVIKDFKKGFLPVLLPVILICGLIAPANLSTALLLGVACCMLFFIGRVDLKHIGLLIISGLLLVGMIFTYSKVTNTGRAATWEKRIENFRGGGDDDDNFQTEQANIAIANGKFFGLGPSHGQAKNLLPHAYSDFIYAIIIEEFGMLGGIVLVGLYMLFLWRCILIFKRCPYAFGAFLAIGLSFTLVFQALINMAVNVHLLPVTGLTLPMVSMGGSSIWFTSIAIGLILSVSRYVETIEGASAEKTAKQVAKIEQNSN